MVLRQPSESHGYVSENVYYFPHDSVSSQRVRFEVDYKSIHTHVVVE